MFSDARAASTSAANSSKTSDEMTPSRCKPSNAQRFSLGSLKFFGFQLWRGFEHLPHGAGKNIHLRGKLDVRVVPRRGWKLTLRRAGVPNGRE
jgi:hypothetical protein